LKKLDVVDLNFCWPTDNGASADLVGVLSAFATKYRTTLILPRITRVGHGLERPWPLNRTKFFLRGQAAVSESWPFAVETIDFSAFEFSPRVVVRRLRERLAQRAPDHLVLADSWYFRPDLVLGLADYRPPLLFYSHEMVCPKANGVLFRRGAVCDVQYLDGTLRSYATCAACSASFLAGFPSPRWVFEFLRTGAFRRDYQRRCREAFASAACVVVRNHFMASRIAPYTKAPVLVVPHPIDCRRFHPRPRQAAIKRILVTGHIEAAVKGLGTAVEACRRLWTKRQDFRLLTVSASSRLQLPFVESMSWRPHERVHEIYQEADMALVPSLYPDPFPIVALEAMASGLPVVGSAVGGLPEQIIDSQTGFLFPPGDAAALEARIAWLLDHPEQAEEMGRRGRERVLAEFAAEVVFDRHYRDLFGD